MADLNTQGDRPPDPETLGMVFLIGGFLAVASFIAMGLAHEAGPKLDSPGPIANLQKAFDQATR
jgi:hypothetical protein